MEGRTCVRLEASKMNALNEFFQLNNIGSDTAIYMCSAFLCSGCFLAGIDEEMLVKNLRIIYQQIAELNKKSINLRFHEE